MSLVQMAALSIFGANLVGYILYWIDGNQLAMLDKLLWMVLMAIIFGIEVVGALTNAIEGEENEGDRPHQ